MFASAESNRSDALTDAAVAAIDALAADEPAVLDHAAVLDRLRAVGRLADRLEAERVRLIDAADRCGALAEDGAATAAAWLRRHSTLTATQAAARAKLARRLAALPTLAAAFATGDLGVAHLTAIDGLCADVGVDQVAAVQAELATAATRLADVRQFGQLCAGWRHALRPDAADAADDRAYATRGLGFSATFDGRFHLAGDFDAEGGATIAAALDAYTCPDPAGTPPELRRSARQRRADALVEIARRALGADDAPANGGVRAHVVVRVNMCDLPGVDIGRRGGRPPEIDWGGPIGSATLARLLSDSAVTRILTAGGSQILDVGTATRVWPAAIRRAIIDRDRGCRFDPCDRPAAWCDIDHVIPVAEDGPTAVGNGILLCRHHHRAKRRDGWWPTLRPDATVTWTHPDGRTRSDPPPAALDSHIQTLLGAGDTTPARPDRAASSAAAYTPADAPDHTGDLAGETPATYHPGRRRHPTGTDPPTDPFTPEPAVSPAATAVPTIAEFGEGGPSFGCIDRGGTTGHEKTVLFAGDGGRSSSLLLRVVRPFTTYAFGVEQRADARCG